MIKRAIRYILSFILYYSGFIIILRWIQKKQNKFKILVYHRVNDNFEGSVPVLSVFRFRKHMSYLKRYYKIISLIDGISYIKNNKNFPVNAIAVTFDDGFKDIIQNVITIIKELDIPITIFLTTDCIGDNKMLWTDSLYYFFKENNRLNEFYQFKEDLKEVDNSERIKTIETHKPRVIKNSMLNWTEVKQLCQDNHIEIGSHTQTHHMLTKITQDFAIKEIVDSKKDIEEIIQRPVIGFSYPAAKYNPEIKKIVKNSGFAYACSVDGKFNTKTSDLYALSRINIDNCPVFVFACEICGILNWLRRLFK